MEIISIFESEQILIFTAGLVDILGKHVMKNVQQVFAIFAGKKIVNLPEVNHFIPLKRVNSAFILEIHWFLLL